MHEASLRRELEAVEQEMQSATEAFERRMNQLVLRKHYVDSRLFCELNGVSSDRIVAAMNSLFLHKKEVENRGADVLFSVTEVVEFLIYCINRRGVDMLKEYYVGLLADTEELTDRIDGAVAGVLTMLKHGECIAEGQTLLASAGLKRDYCESIPSGVADNLTYTVLLLDGNARGGEVARRLVKAVQGVIIGSIGAVVL